MMKMTMVMTEIDTGKNNNSYNDAVGNDIN